MGCICCYYEINNCAVPQGCKGRKAPLAHTYSGETNMKKKDIIGLQRNNKTKINPHCGMKIDYWTHEVRHIKSFAPTSVFLYNRLRAFDMLAFIYFCLHTAMQKLQMSLKK